ncbi:MAG: hypothetical protein NC489_23910 [Ruminococcus flavefaciens]|nr:hypothetical protein [Ruminococcus flavefaciens]
MYQDVADYEFYLTGKYMPDLIVAAITMVMWLGMILLGRVTSIIAMKWYPLTPKKMSEAQAVNKQRAENAALKVSE